MKRALTPFILFLGLFMCSCQRPESPSAEVKRITVWTVGSEGNKISLIAKDFEKLHPDIRLTIVKLDWEVARDQILSAISKGETPDLCEMGTTWMAEFVQTGTLAPLDDFVFLSKTVAKENFFAGPWETNVVKGTLYGIPWYFETRLLFYRRDLLEKMNLPHPPRTWDELVKWADILTTDENADGKPETFGLALNYVDAKTIIPFVWQNGGEFLNADGTATSLCGEKEKEALQFFVNLFKKGSVLPREQNPAEAFVAGRCAMTISGPWQVTVLQKEMAGKENLWGMAPLPQKQHGTSYFGGANFAIFNSCKNKEAAWRFIEFLSTPENQAQWFRYVSALPAVKAAWEEPHAFTNGDFIAVFKTQLRDVKTFPAIAPIEVIANLLEKTILQAIDSSEELSPLLDRLCDEINALLK